MAGPHWKVSSSVSWILNFYHSLSSWSFSTAVKAAQRQKKSLPQKAASCCQSLRDSSFWATLDFHLQGGIWTWTGPLGSGLKCHQISKRQLFTSGCFQREVPFHCVVIKDEGLELIVCKDNVFLKHWTEQNWKVFFFFSITANYHLPFLVLHGLW